MSQLFFRPKNPELAEMWGRCDLCRWSGPFDRFLVYRRGVGEVAVICTHSWCGGKDEVLRGLHANGWVLDPNPQAPGLEDDVPF